MRKVSSTVLRGVRTGNSLILLDFTEPVNVVIKKHWSRLQKTLLHSWSAKCLAVRRVTQENTGKKTAGVDGLKSLTQKQRIELVGRLKLTGKASPTRRVWIPKPGTKEKRPLGIPVIYDRALQALTKLALEPEWEALFEPAELGF